MGPTAPSAKVRLLLVAACTGPGPCNAPNSVISNSCSKMDMAVTNEDYSLAAQARDQYNVSHWLRHPLLAPWELDSATTHTGSATA